MPRLIVIDDHALFRAGLTAILKKESQFEIVGAFMDVRLIDHVKFDNHNLITGAFNKKFDIIFCRNVMIYFDNAAKMKLFNRFHESLNPGGLFIIGFYDAVSPLVDETKFKVLDSDAKIFVRS